MPSKNHKGINMKKTIQLGIFLTILIATALQLEGCKNKTTDVTNDEQKESIAVEKDSIAAEKETGYLPAIDRYLVNEIGSNYSKAEICVPFHFIVDVDEHNAEDILVWGDFWVLNYNQVGDTLKTISGGNHPGLMHLCKTANGFEVKGFDQVADGDAYLKSAKEIFGDKYESFEAVQSDEKKREQRRSEVLADYVKTHNLSATMYQDYGWPAKKLGE